MKLQTIKNVINEMRTVAGGEIAAPADAAEPSIEFTTHIDALSRCRDRSLCGDIHYADVSSRVELQSSKGGGFGSGT